MKEQTFNRWFNILILSGMTIALLVTSAIKLRNGSHEAADLIVVSAIGSLMGVLATVCSANGKIITFLFGLLDVLIYGVMCLVNWKSGYSGLGNAILHFVYFVPMQFVGFFQWKKLGGKGGRKLKAKRLDGRSWAILTALFLVFSVAAYVVIARFDRSSAETFVKLAVVLDVLPLMCNIAGQFLMSTAYMEQWIFWIGVNIFSIVMWASTLHADPDSFAVIYIIKYSFYLLNSFNGLRIWIGLSKNDDLA